jgi:hypothetical protein
MSAGEAERADPPMLSSGAMAQGDVEDLVGHLRGVHDVAVTSDLGTKRLWEIHDCLHRRVPAGDTLGSRECEAH